MMTKSADERQKVIQRALKVLALTKSPNEGEALAAAERLQAMMAEHKLTVNDLGRENDPMVRDSDLLTNNAGWVTALLGQVARTYFCGYFVEPLPAELVESSELSDHAKALLAASSDVYLRHNFVGEQANVIVARQMGRYLIETMERLCTEAAGMIAASERIQFRLTFVYICCARICTRLEERRLASLDDATQVGDIKLPALRSLYEQAEDRFTSWAADKGLKQANVVAPLDSMTSREGLEAGYRAGNRIGLDEQLRHERAEQQIAYEEPVA